MKTYLFTPFDDKNVSDKQKDDMGRVNLKLSQQDINKIGRGYEWSAIVTDTETKIKYKVRDADCGAGNCRCAAEIISIVK